MSLRRCFLRGDKGIRLWTKITLMVFVEMISCKQNLIYLRQWVYALYHFNGIW